VKLLFIGPESPLEKGIIDELAKEGINSLGLTKQGDQIETNKVFMKKLFEDYNIPGEAFEFIDSFDESVVIKPIGLTGEKGVKILGNQLESNEESKEYVKEIF